MEKIEYKIEMVIKLDTQSATDWILQSIQDQLEMGEEVSYFKVEVKNA